jgi:CIC family chloride channel protein
MQDGTSMIKKFKIPDGFKGKKKFWRYLLRWTLLSIPTALATSFGIVLLVLTTESMWNMIYDGRIPRPLIVFIPAVGGLIAGYIASRTTVTALHGVDMIVNALHKYGGNVPYLTAPIGFLTSLVTVGSGGSAGLEGPSLQIGGTAGSAVASKLKVSARDRRILVLCGAAAGISAVFKAPLTGAIFALEIPYKNDLEHEAVIPALISSVVSYITFILILGGEPLFKVATVSFTYQDVPIFILHGVFSAVVGVLYVKFYHKTGDVFHRIKLPIAVKAGLGGLAVGIIGLVAPHVLGIGYAGIQGMLDRSFPFEYVIMLLVLKILATSFTLGSGGNGGLFIPTVFIGTATGTIFGMLLMPNETRLFEILGMAGVLAASSKAPLAAVAFVAETTNPSYIIPAIISSVVAYLASGGVTLYSQQQIVRPTLAETMVEEVMEEQFVTLNVTSTLDDLANEVFRSHHKVFPVLDTGTLAGTVSISDMMRIPRHEWPKTKVSVIMEKRVFTANPEESVSEVVATMGARGIAMVPVVDPKNSSRMIGVIYRYDILHAIDERKLE